MFKYVLVVPLHHGKFLINLKVSVKMNFMVTNIFGKKVNFLQNQRIGKDLKKNNTHITFNFRFINNPDGNALETK